MAEPGGRFVHRLALALGKSLGEVRSWPAAELMEWAIYSQFEPLPDPYWIGAQIACVTANVNRARGRASRIEDFIPRPRHTPRRQSPEEMIAVLRAVAPPPAGGPDHRHHR